MDFWTEKNDIVILFITVIPKASQDEVAGIRADMFGQNRLLVRLKAVPEKGKANKALIDFIAKKTRIAKSYLSLISGETNRQKNIRIDLPMKDILLSLHKLYP